MTTPTPNVQLQTLQSPELLPPGSPGTVPLPGNVHRHPGPYNLNQGILFILQPDPALVPNSTLIPDIQYVMNPNGQTVANQPIIYFPPVRIPSNTAAVWFYIPYKNNVTKTDGIWHDPVFAVGGRVYDPTGIVYGYLTQIFACLIK
jgi:hypothetical protein